MLRQHISKIIILLYVQACAWLTFIFLLGAAVSFFGGLTRVPTVLIAALAICAAAVLSPLWLGLRRWLIFASSNPKLPLWEGFYYFGGMRRYLLAVWYGVRSFAVHVLYVFLFLSPGAMLLIGCFQFYVRANSDGLLLAASVGFMVGFCLLLIGLAALIWFLQRYFLTAAYLCSGCSVGAAVKQSVQVMGHDKLACAKLWASYMPMFLSCLLIVPVLYVVPHFLCASVIFSRVLMMQNK